MFVAVKRAESLRGVLHVRHWTFRLITSSVSAGIALAAYEESTVGRTGRTKVTYEWNTQSRKGKKLIPPPAVPADIGQEGVNKMVRGITVDFAVESDKPKRKARG